MRGLSLLFFLTLSLPSLACECLWQGSFADITNQVDYISRGRIVQIKGNSMDIEVLDELKGTSYREQVRIWLKTGDLCRAEIENFEIGEQWIVALHKIDSVPEGGFNPMTPNISYGRKGDYSLSGCGGYFLPVSDNWVSGPIIDTTKWDFEPKLTPVLARIIKGYVSGDIDRTTLKEATEVDPALRELMINTRLHIKR
jgi:hypothetical protein